MKLYKYKSLRDFEFFLDIIINERLYCSEYQKLNDPFEGVFLTITRPLIATIKPHPLNTLREIKTIKDLPFSKKSKVCSLSASLSDVRLWSYYAEGLKGVAIELDFTGIENSVIAVKYVNEIQKHGTTLLGGSTAEEVLSFKSTHWEFEKEYRIIQEETYFPIIDRITAVYAGSRISQEHFGFLRKLVPEKVPVYETKVDPETITVSPRH